MHVYVFICVCSCVRFHECVCTINVLACLQLKFVFACVMPVDYLEYLGAMFNTRYSVLDVHYYNFFMTLKILYY